MRLCPTLWMIEDVLKLDMSFKKEKDMNTAQNIMTECRSQNQAGCVIGEDFIHFGKGTRMPNEIIHA